MIRALTLEKFGRFGSARFEFGAFTVFLGPNEAGKTTIFDAIFSRICGLKRNTAEGRRIHDRYGSGAVAGIEFSGESFTIDRDEFMALYAIQSGDIDIDFTGGQWLDRVKASVFTGGIDPNRIAGNMSALASDRGNLSHVRERRDAQKRLDSARERLAALLDERGKVLNRERASGDKEARKASLERDMSSARAAVSSLEARVKQQELLRERTSLLRVMDMLAAGKSIDARLEALSRFSADESTTLDALVASVKEADTGILSNRAQHQALADEMRRFEAEREAQLVEREGVRPASELAGMMLDRIERGRPLPAVKKSVRWNPLFVAGALIVAAGGATGAALVQEQLYRITLACLGGLFLFLGLVLARRVEQTLVPPDETEYAGAIRAEWHARTGDGVLNGSTVDELRVELWHRQMAYDNASKAAARAEQNFRIVRQRAAAMDASHAGLLAAREKASAALSAWLSERGLASPDAYRPGRAELERARREREEWAASTARECASRGADGPGQLEALCLSRISALAIEITERQLSDAELNGLAKELASRRAELEKMASELPLLAEDLGRDRGAVHASMGDLPERIAALGRDISLMERNVEELDITREANAVAASIFGDMALDGEALFRSLSEEVARTCGEVFPGSRGVSLGAFDPAALWFADAGGAMRRVEQLSRGTRDLFVFALRLTLAAHSWSGDGPGLLVLDEPFLSLDGGRANVALALVRRFIEERGWQAVLLTKDEGLVSGALAGMDGMVVLHRLERAGPA